VILDCFLKLVQTDIWTSSVVNVAECMGTCDAPAWSCIITAISITSQAQPPSILQSSNDYRQLGACILANFDVGSCRFT
jgi:hypothetical protein